VELVRLYSNPQAKAGRLRLVRSAASAPRPGDGPKRRHSQRQRRLSMIETEELIKAHERQVPVKEQANKPVLRAALKPDRACTIAIQALCRGPFDWRVQGVTGAAARQGAEHVALRYGRVLLYLEDRAALDALVAAGEAAYELGEEVFGPDAAKYLDRAADGDQASDNDRAPEAAEA
jgi:hypothetical protein